MQSNEYSIAYLIYAQITDRGLASYYPSVRMLGRTVTPEYAPFVPLVAAVFLTVSISLWNFGTRHYSSTGS